MNAKIRPIVFKVKLAEMPVPRDKWQEMREFQDRRDI